MMGVREAGFAELANDLGGGGARVQSPLRVGKPPGWHKEMPGAGWGPVQLGDPLSPCSPEATAALSSGEGAIGQGAGPRLFPGRLEETELGWTKLRATGS